jgi:hypothetical protein
MNAKKIMSIVVLSIVFSALLFSSILLIDNVSQSIKKFMIIFMIYAGGMASIVLATRLRKKVTPDEIYGASGSCGIGGCGSCESKDLCQLDFSKIDLT